jgi:hypothetical protein
VPLLFRVYFIFCLQINFYFVSHADTYPWTLDNYCTWIKTGSNKNSWIKQKFKIFNFWIKQKLDQTKINLDQTRIQNFQFFFQLFWSKFHEFRRISFERFLLCAWTCTTHLTVQSIYRLRRKLVHIKFMIWLMFLKSVAVWFCVFCIILDIHPNPLQLVVCYRIIHP